jgi:uncharacterized protein
MPVTLMLRAWAALVLIALLLPWHSLQAQALQPVPALKARAMDLSATLSAQELAGQDAQIKHQNQDGGLPQSSASPASQHQRFELEQTLKRAAPGMDVARLFEAQAHTGDQAVDRGEVRKQLPQQKRKIKPSSPTSTGDDSVIVFISFVGFLFVVVATRAFLSVWRACAVAASIIGITTLLFTRDLGAAAALALCAALVSLADPTRPSWKFNWFGLLRVAGGSTFKSGRGGDFGGGGASGHW